MTFKLKDGADLDGQRITNVGDPSGSTDAANKQYVDGVARGLNWHDHVRAIPTASITISSPGSTADGVTLAANDRLLLINQSTGSQNGLWVWNGAASALTRPTDYSAAQVFTKGSVTVTVTEGTVSADRVYTMSTDGTVTVDTTATTWAQVGGAATYVAGDGLTESPSFTFNVNAGTGLETSSDALRIAASAAGAGLTGGAGSALAVGAGTGITVNADDVAVNTTVVARKFSQSIGAITGGSPVTITHGLGNQDVIVAVREASSPTNYAYPTITFVDTNSITLTFANSYSTGTYRVIVVG